MRSPLPTEIRHVAIVAPASPVEPMLLRSGIDAIQSYGVDIDVAARLFEPADTFPYLAANDQFRADDFNRALSNPSIDMLIATRGGYGTMRILDAIDWTAFGDRPYLGFSDNTAILLAMIAKKVGRPIAGIHAARFGDLPQHPRTADSLRWALNPSANFDIPLDPDAKVFQPGTVKGPLYAVNLSIFCSLIGTPYLPDMKGVILLVEDIGEPLRKIDRALTQLRLSGILGQLGGLLLGQFSEYPDDPILLQKLFASTAQFVNGPVISGIPFGHETGSLCLPYSTVFIKNSSLSLLAD